MRHPLVSSLFLLLSACVAVEPLGSGADVRPLELATFHVDVTPPLGSPLCHGAIEPAKEIVDPLSARGVILTGQGAPIVLCSVDWVGIGNAGNHAWKEALARAANTHPERVAVHTVHQHDAPGCDFAAEELLAAHGLGGKMIPADFCRDAIERVAKAVAHATHNRRKITHLGIGRARVHEVASNRRVLGANGKVQYVRYSKCRIPEAIAAPEGLIDPWVQVLSFWNGDDAVAALSYYATHPQSHYGKGGVSADFVGMARSIAEKQHPGLAWVHFNGAGGNVAAGKYNDGSPARRPILANRLAKGMRKAWNTTLKTSIGVGDISWRAVPCKLPPRAHLKESTLLPALGNTKLTMRDRIRAARDLTWLRHASRPIDLTCLRVGPAWILHMPGELFVEYQLAAQQMKPDAFVAMAAYGDYGPGYIGTKISYGQGGYETGAPSRTAPEVEDVLMSALHDLLDVERP